MEEHIEEFENDDLEHRLAVVNSPESPDVDFSSHHDQGHIPGANNVPAARVLADDRRFRSADELRDLYAEHDVDGDESVITYCRVGEHSSIEWFTLHELLGFDDVRNYDGS